jgi:glycosyltransferase XagB
LRPILTVAPRSAITAAQVALYGPELAQRAEVQAPQATSCREWRAHSALRWTILLSAVLALLAVLTPVVVTAILFLLAILIFAGNMVLKLCSFAASRRAENVDLRRGSPAGALPLRMPVVSLLVPLYREQDMAATLVSHLSRLAYPPECLDVLLIVEAEDTTTQAALAATPLAPGWRVLTAPPGHLRTKPRALNFALPFARGEIVGVYDAEDQPQPDQIEKVVSRFAECPAEVACLQGRLDYFNARHNLMSRLFAIEYATWFRVMLPGVQKLGLVVPLGGTTQFLRRDILTRLGGWDAHNVTEDAELGLRIARHGYRTEMLETTTFEEANAAVLPWLRQRARWQKGYLMTWAMTMRHPLRLWRDLGTLRCLALQVQMLGAVAGFLAAPLLWSLMIKPFGYAHPLDALVGPTGYGILGTAFVASSVLSVAVALQATRAAHLRHLRPAILLLEFYFLLATLSAWKAVLDMLLRPFTWDKTAHGAFGALATDQAISPRPSAPLPSDAPRRRSTDDP